MAMENEMNKHVAVAFPTPSEVGPRPWGKEILLALVPGAFSFKRLEMNAGHKGRVQYHHKKNEVGYLLSGTLIIRHDPTGAADENGKGALVERVLEPGAVFHFPTGSVHQEEAVTDCVILEVSTPFFNDRVGMEDHYGLPVPEGGLPSTKPEEVTDTP